MENYYKILGLNVGATLEEVEEKYNKLLEEFNPEKQEKELKDFFAAEKERVLEAYLKILENSIELKKEQEEVIEKEIDESENNDTDEVEPWKNFEKEEETDALNQPSSILEVTGNAKEGLILALDKMVYWAKFLSVIGYISVGLLIIWAIYMLIQSTDTSMYYQQDFYLQQFFLYFCFSIIFYFPTTYLFNFATQTRKALLNNDKKELEGGLQNLGSNFKFMGVMTLVVLSIDGIYLLYSIS